MYKVDNIDELYDTLDMGHRVYLGEMVKKCVVPNIIGYMESHRCSDTELRGIPVSELERKPYFMYHMKDNYTDCEDGTKIRVSMFSPNAVKITLFNRDIFDDKCLDESKNDGVVFFIPEYINQKI